MNFKIDYNQEFFCTYKLFDDEYNSNLCYQIQLLQAFNMNKYDETILHNKIASSYYYLKDNKQIIEIIDLLIDKFKEATWFCFLPEDKSPIIYQILFSYTYFNEFHKYFAEYLKKNKSDIEKNSITIQDNCFDKLIEFIQKQE
jgi:hypothetical protein